MTTDAIARLADLGVQLIGIDTASMDPAGSTALDSHMLVRARGLRVLENFGAGRRARGRLRADCPAAEADGGRGLARACHPAASCCLIRNLPFSAYLASAGSYQNKENREICLHDRTHCHHRL